MRVELTPSFPARPGQKVLVHVIADSLSGITSRTLAINGQPLTLDGFGRAEFIPAAPGKLLVSATATDGDGRTGSAAGTLKVRNPADDAAPIVSFAAQLNRALITETRAIVATVSDLNLDAWTLELARIHSDQFSTVAQGEANVADESLFQLDPAILPNGFYRLRLTAHDVAGRSSWAEIVIEINSTAKAGRYERSETDLAVVLDGVPVQLVRAYDSLAGHRAGSFGVGWRLAGADVDLETDVPLTGREHLGVFSPYVMGTRLYLNLADGRRAGFTFTPQLHQAEGLAYYTPAWTADAGVDDQLASAHALLTRAGNRFYDLRTARPYNPAAGAWDGPQFTLTAADGTAYHVSANEGVQALITPAGARVVYSDSGIIGPGGSRITFVHDAAGRIMSAAAPDGSRVIYGYDAAGRLASVRRLTTGESVRYGYGNGANRHRLTLAAGQAGQVILYGDTIQVAPVAGNLGTAHEFTGRTMPEHLGAGATDRYTLAVRSSEVASTETDTVLLGIVVEAEPGNTLEPAAPQLAGLTPLVSHTSAGRSFSLFVVSEPGLQLLELAGAGAGNYTLQVFVAGDVNLDGLVDGLDSQQQETSVGSSAGGTTYIAAADADRNGTVNASDVQLLGANFGFIANRPPAVSRTSVLTHQDLEISIPLDQLATDPEDDPLLFRIVSATNGAAHLGVDGRSVWFVPDSGFVGTAAFEILADDGFSQSDTATITVNVSDAHPGAIEDPGAAASSGYRGADRRSGVRRLC